MNLSSLNLECKYKNNMQCIHNIQNTYFAEIEQIEFVQQYKCLFGLIFRNQTFQTLFTFPEQESNCSWLQFFHFTGCMFVEKERFPNDLFMLERLFAKTSCSFSFRCAPSMFSFYCSYVLSKSFICICIFMS